MTTIRVLSYATVKCECREWPIAFRVLDVGAGPGGADREDVAWWRRCGVCRTFPTLVPYSEEYPSA